MPGFERGANHLIDILRAAGEVEQQFGAGLDRGIRRVEQDFADLPPDRGAAGLNGFNHFAAVFAQRPRKHAELGGLAAPVNAFECDELPALRQQSRFSQSGLFRKTPGVRGAGWRGSELPCA